MGDDSLLRVFYNTKLARSYRPAGKRVEVDLYRERREVYECHKVGAEIPDGVLLLTAAVDVMDSYLCYEIVGWGKFKESWGIEAGDIRGDPRAPGGEVWEALDKFVYNRLFRYEDGRCARARLVFIDQRRALHQRSLPLLPGPAAAGFCNQGRRRNWQADHHWRAAAGNAAKARGFCGWALIR